MTAKTTTKKSPAKKPAAKKPAAKATMPRRERLRQAYLYVVDNWAVGNSDLKAAGIDPALMKALQPSGLVEAYHVNGERAVTWQSHFDVQNGDPREDAEAAFDKAFPAKETPEPATKTGNGATGPRYTPGQIAVGMRLTREGKSAKAVAAEVGVKSPSYFRKLMLAEIAKADVKKAKDSGSSNRKPAAKKATKKPAAKKLAKPSGKPKAANARVAA
jgi:hypothetical protein